MRWMLALLFAFATSASVAQGSDPFTRSSQWTASESWGKSTPTYTFEPTGTFKSSDWDNGRGRGSWIRAGKTFLMIWPQYDGVVYQGTIEGTEIRGTAYTRDGSTIGTFVLRLIR